MADTLKALMGADVSVDPTTGRARLDISIEALADLISGGRLATVDGAGIDADSHFNKQVALTGAQQEIDLEGTRHVVHAWLDDDAAPTKMSLNEAPTATMTERSPSKPLIRVLDSDGATKLYVLASAASGNINVEAW